MTETASDPTILLVDDNPDHLILMRRQLQRVGFAVVGEAITPEQAASLAGEHEPDVVVMDLRLSGMEPREVISMIKEASSTSSIIVVSSSGVPDPQAFLAGTEADVFVDKGSTEELIVEIKRLVENE